MQIAIGSDHRGYSMKLKLADLLTGLGHAVSDEGTHSTESCDYPDISSAVAKKVSSGEADRGILICGTGIGMAITANKFPRVRATTCQDEITAEICRRHNDVNVLCLSGDLLGESRLDNLLRVWLDTEFEGGRHARRLEKIAEIEDSWC
ncbi:MAG: ribose 5-phosphate isomerase B [Planctomycetaceae bacterium]|nr:ribose 5-phosphate isomerase B [Planctomycetales bacterium]MCB9927665.1 ribose 5-phosphate isomerase B [Planctomycetaceae bacterium]